MYNNKNNEQLEEIDIRDIPLKGTEIGDNFLTFIPRFKHRAKIYSFGYYSLVPGYSHPRMILETIVYV